MEKEILNIWKDIWKSLVSFITKNPLFSFLIGFFWLAVLLLTGLDFAIRMNVGNIIPSDEAIWKPDLSVGSEIYSRDGELMGRFFLKDRIPVSYHHIPIHLTEALLATEDIRFYSHQGVDSRSLFRVAIKNLLMGQRQAGGGSTLTQQLAKMWFPRKEFMAFSLLINKLREMEIARRIEDIYAKDEILSHYLNTAFWGHHAYGIEAASNRYFSKDCRSLNLEEGAALVGMLQAPSYYDPVKYPERTTIRRNLVLGQIAKYGFLDSTSLDSIRKLPLVVHYQALDPYEGMAPHFRVYLSKVLEKWTESNRGSEQKKWNLFTDELRIYTTIDSRLQKYAEEAIHRNFPGLQARLDRQWRGSARKRLSESLFEYHKKRSERYQNWEKAGFTEGQIDSLFEVPVQTRLFTWKGFRDTSISPRDSLIYSNFLLQSGFIAVSPNSSEILSWVGGVNFQHAQYDHVRSRRQVGSVFKPIVYAAALESGIEPCDYISNEQVTYGTYGNWSPENADQHYGGEYSMQGALTHSVNVVSVQILMEVGAAKVVQKAREFGLEGNIPPVPSIALGTAEASLLEMTKAYGAMANHGKMTPEKILLRIEGPDGEILYNQERQNSEVVLNDQYADALIQMLRGVIKRGTGSKLRNTYKLDIDMAGKTGTTQKQTDGWFIGITPNLVAGVWVGADDPRVHFRTMAGQGATTALPVFGDFMKKALADPAFARWKEEKFDLELGSSLDCDEYLFPVAMSDFKKWWDEQYGVDSLEVLEHQMFLEQMNQIYIPQTENGADQR